jgi:ATP-dependent HslUV protease ATP-binding subunit HslU
LLKQYSALLQADGIDLEFDDSGIDEIAKLARQVNDQTENIGARRLHTIVEKLLDEISFAAPEVEENEYLSTPNTFASVWPNSSKTKISAVIFCSCRNGTL